MKRYILPTTDWASLVLIIVRDAPPDAVIETDTEDMVELVRQALDELGAPTCISCSATRCPGRLPRLRDAGLGVYRTGAW